MAQQLQNDGGTRNRYGKPEGKYTLRQHPVDQYGSDKAGLYWGVKSPTAGRVYVAEAGPNWRRYVWALSREEACHKMEINPAELLRPLR